MPRVGGRRGRGLPRTRRVLGSAGCILASLKVLLPWVHLKKRETPRARKKRYQREAASHVLGRWAPQSSGQTVLIALRTGGWGISTQHGKLGNQNTHL
jgi:hypothetical protein